MAAPDEAPDLTAAPAAQAEVPPELVAQTFGEYARAYVARVRNGQSGVLPVVLGLVAIMVVFEVISPNHVFLSAGNLVNLFQQSAVFMVLAMAETFALLLGEIDLSIGFVGACGAVIAVQLVQPVTTNWPWWAAIIAALAFCFAVGALQGTIITRLGIPSFVVTLAGFLIFNGVMLILLLLGPFSGYPNLTAQSPNVQVLFNLMSGTIDPTLSWIVVAISDINRANFGTLAGVPWVVPIVLAVLGAWTILLERTKYGRYVYAIGGNPEAARRAGINLAVIRTVAFALCSMTAGIGVLLYASYIGGMSNNVQGGQFVLFAVAAAVIGGTSLFGGRGKVIHGVLGGLLIGGINNGMYLQGLDVQRIFIVTGLVLLAAVTIDAVSRRAAASGSAARV